MLPTWSLVVLALLAGVAIAAQAGVNATLGRSLRDPGLAALVSFAVGTAALALFVLARRPILPDEALASAPWWAWVGGLLGAFFVTLSVVIAPRLGAATALSLVVAAQLATALVLDHFGWLGFDERVVSWPRVVGVAMLVAGAALVRIG